MILLDPNIWVGNIIYFKKVISPFSKWMSDVTYFKKWYHLFKWIGDIFYSNTVGTRWYNILEYMILYHLIEYWWYHCFKY